MELHHVLLMIAVIVGLIVLVWNLEHHLAAIEAWLAGMGHWAGLGFVLLFVVLTPMGYLFSVTRVRFVPYLAATSGIFVYNTAIIYLGYAARHLSTAVAQDGSVPASHLPLIAGIAGTVVVVYLISRVARARIEALSSPGT